MMPSAEMNPPVLTRQAIWRRRFPNRYRAHLAVGNALRRGILVKQPCEVCGVDRVDAHHDDYRKPLSVRWLCRRHHIALHRGALS